MTTQTKSFPWRVVAVAAVLAVTAGCASTPAGMNAPQAGGASMPAQWQYGAAATGVAATRAVLTLDEAWWQRFNDTQLDALVQKALARQPDLAVAALRVRQAQLRADTAYAARLPEVSARLSATATRPLEGGASTTRGASASLAASWEVDLWGRLRTQSDAAMWEARATEDDRRALALSMAGTVARLYWQLAYLDQRVESSQQSLAYARRTADLVMTQHKVGSVSGLEEAQARQAVSAQESALAQLIQTRVEARQSLALLLDEPTQSDTLPQPRWPQVERPVIDPGLPADVLSRRPDLRAAEARLRKAYATVDATRAGYYPTLSLTGSVGGSSESLSNVLRDPVGTLGAALVLPFLQWRDMQRSVAVSQAEADAAVITFRQTLYQALADVDKALSAQAQLQLQLTSQGERLAQARTVERLSELRYRSGAEPLKTWLDAQESRRQAELAHADVRYSQLSNWVALVQALGGGPTR